MTQFPSQITKCLQAVQLAGISALFMLSGTVNAAEQAEDSHNLLLIGSAMQVCSSMNQEACHSVDWINANEMRTARLFNLSDVRRREAMRQAVWPRERESIREEVIEALEMMADYFGYGVVPEHRLVERFRSRQHLYLLSRLTEEEYYRILDGLEMPTMEGLREHARVAESSDASGSMLQRFVEITAKNSGTETPVIYVVTAAQRDTLGSFERYETMLSDAGAEARWLPIDATVVRAQQQGNCDSLDSLRRRVNGAYDRARVHSDLHAQQLQFCQNEDAWQGMIEQADGVFFADGSQSLLRAAFYKEEGEASGLLTAIQRKLEAHEVTVAAAGGASIALSAATMVTNGSSREAMTEGSMPRPAPRMGCDQDESCPRGVNLNSLTYQPLGGLELYPFGMVDTEVSERGYQGRMLRLAADTATALATGIDRSTGLLINTTSGEFEVLGESGVLFLERSTGNERMVASTFHFLRNGSTGTINRGHIEDIQMAQQQRFRPESITTRFLGDTGFYDNVARLCEGREQQQLLQDDFTLLMQRTEQTETLRTEGRCQVVNGTLGIAWQPQAVR